MSFQSYSFLFVLLPVTVIGWRALNRFGYGRTAQVFLLGASLVFYALGSLLFLPVLTGSLLFNFLVGRGLTVGVGKKRALLVLGILGNLGVLGYFKYTNFLLENINILFGTSVGALAILLPLGISFFTFQQIAYLVDAYRGEAEPYSLLEYAVYVTFFPCVASGPIAFHSEVIPQIRAQVCRRASGQELAEGLWLFSLGMWKKVIVAQTFGAATDWGYSSLAALDSTSALAVAVCYSFQLYFDFAGYTDMARGIGRMLGITLPENFDAPYRALTIRGFWKGWHMTMTRFFTRYLFIPLGGSRRGTARTCLNIMIIFLVSGLWHGADWSFVLWGGIHGAAMVADRLLGSRVERLHPALSWALTFGFVTFAWIFFRAPDVTSALDLCGTIAQCSFGPLPPELLSQFHLPEETWLVRMLGLDFSRVALLMFLIFMAFAFLFCLQEREACARSHAMTARRGVLAGVCLFWSVISLTGATQFIYSNF